MEELKEILINLKEMGACGIKISFEDEGALYNEIISMRNLTSSVGVQLSVKIGGCEAKRDIIDCIDLGADAIVAPMVESGFALKKFLKSLSAYKYDKKKGFNLETVGAYNNLSELAPTFDKLDFVTFGRVDFVGSLGKDRDYVDSDDIFNKVSDVFKEGRKHNTMNYMGGAISIKSKDFIGKLIEQDLIDKFETRYIIYDVHQIKFKDFEKLLYWGNVFEVKWLKYVSERYSMHASKDVERIKLIESRILCNKQD